MRSLELDLMTRFILSKCSEGMADFKLEGKVNFIKL